MIAYADFSLDAPRALEVAEDRMGRWASRPDCYVRIECPDGTQFHATAYQRLPGVLAKVCSAPGDTQVLALEELALRGCQSGVW
jgi:hypothetical protein